MPKDYGSIGERSGGGDPNILKLETTNKVRPLDNSVGEWRTHTIQDPHDPQKVTMIVCPGQRQCPLCRKPCGPKWDNERNGFEQYWPTGKRFAANVWDYTSNSVKVLIAGPQVFDEFKTAYQVGIMPDSCDWTIARGGQGRQTKYTTVRHDASPAPQVHIDQLHDIAKYEAPDSVEKIFDTLERYGIDYDTLPTPSFSEDEALAFVMPYTKHKGLTIEALLDVDEQYAQWLHGTKVEQGALGDPVFLALQGALESRGLAEPLDDYTPPPVERESHVTPALQEKLTNTGGNVSEVEAPAEGEVRLIAPNGSAVNVPEATAEGLLLAGFTRAAAAEPEQDQNAPTTILIGGQAVELPYAQAKALVDSGAASWELAGAAEPEAEPVLPNPTDPVEVEIGGNAVPLPFAQAFMLVNAGTATYVDEDVAAAVAWHKQNDKHDNESVAQQADAEQAAAPVEDDKPFKCDQCDAAYKSKGGLTSHVNRDHAAAVAATPASTPAPAADSTVLDQLKDKITKSPFGKDYQKVLKLFTEVTGKKNIMEMNDTELQAVIDAIDNEEAAILTGIAA